MYRNYEDQNCYRGGTRSAMASRYAQQRSQSEAQAIAIAMPRRQNSLLASPFSILSLLLIISIIIPILVNLVLILLGL